MFVGIGCFCFAFGCWGFGCLFCVWFGWLVFCDVLELLWFTWVWVVVWLVLNCFVCYWCGCCLFGCGFVCVFSCVLVLVFEWVVVGSLGD